MNKPVFRNSRAPNDAIERPSLNSRQPYRPGRAWSVTHEDGTLHHGHSDNLRAAKKDALAYLAERTPKAEPAETLPAFRSEADHLYNGHEGDTYTTTDPRNRSKTTRIITAVIEEPDTNADDSRVVLVNTVHTRWYGAADYVRRGPEKAIVSTLTAEDRLTVALHERGHASITGHIVPGKGETIAQCETWPATPRRPWTRSTPRPWRRRA